jgi:hypothetical protein
MTNLERKCGTKHFVIFASDQKGVGIRWQCDAGTGSFVIIYTFRVTTFLLQQWCMHFLFLSL